MAAIVARGFDAEPSLVVDYALRVWERAGDRLIKEQEEAVKLHSNLRLLDDVYKGIPHPKKYPASLAEFLKLVLACKTPADATKRFRDFLRSSSPDIS
jgi:hypothetical protein